MSSPSSIHAPSDYPQPKTRLIVYFTLHLFSFLSLAALVLTINLSRRIRRDFTLSNLLLGFMMCDLTYSFILFSGTLTPATVDPPFSLCLINACFITGGALCLATAALCLVIRIATKLSGGLGHFSKFSDSPWLTVFLISIPWVAWAAAFIAALVIGLQDRKRVHKAVFYCIVERNVLTSVVTYMAGVILVLTLVGQAIIGIILYRSWASINKLLRQNPLGNSSEKGGARLNFITLALLFRVAVFMLCVLAALIIAIVAANNFTSVVGDMVITAIGPAVFFIFGTQQDILQAWGILPTPSSKNAATPPSPFLSSPHPLLPSARFAIPLDVLSSKEESEPIPRLCLDRRRSSAVGSRSTPEPSDEDVFK